MRVILIDDEQLALNYLEHQLLLVSNIQIVGMYTDALIGQKAIETNDVDLVFLDIQMPEINGLELAEQLLEKKPKLHIVFVTAYDDYAIRAFELNALDYVLKPARQQRLKNTMQRIQRRVEEDSTSPIKEMDILHMSMFQQVTISAEEQQALPLRWRTAKGQQLFLYLVQHRGQIIGKTKLIELLWSDLELEKAYQQLYTAIYHLRKTLRPYSQHFIINTTAEGYLMILRQVNLDVEQFEGFIRSGLGLSSETIADYEQAISWYKGDYLQGHDYIWIESERHRLSLLWIQTALKMVAWYDSTAQLEKALLLCLEVYQFYPQEEGAHLMLMKLFARMGKHSAVQQQYHHLQEILMAEIQEQPSITTTKWYQQWQEEHRA